MSRKPADLLADLRSYGVQLELRGDALIASPKALLTPERCRLIRENKEPLIGALCEEFSRPVWWSEPVSYPASQDPPRWWELADEREFDGLLAWVLASPRPEGVCGHDWEWFRTRLPGARWEYQVALLPTLRELKQRVKP